MTERTVLYAEGEGSRTRDSILLPGASEFDSEETYRIYYNGDESVPLGTVTDVRREGDNITGVVTFVVLEAIELADMFEFSCFARIPEGGRTTDENGFTTVSRCVVLGFTGWINMTFPHINISSLN